jgi:hypothetical protein
VPLGVLNSAAFTDASGLAVAAGAAVEVRRESDSGLAAIFSDRAGTSPISQPGFVADSKGRFTCYAAAIEQGYSVEVDNGSESHTLRNVQVSDPTTIGIQLIEAASAAAALAVLSAWSIAQTRAAIQNAVAAGATILNGYLDWSVAGNVLTVAVKTLAGADPSAGDPVTMIFRSTTAGDGAPVIRTLTAATSISINDTATLGTVNSTPFRLWCVAFDDAGTVRLALINCRAGTAPNFSIYPLGAWGIASSTLEDNASDSGHVFYSAGAAVTSKAYAVLGYATWESGLATAGTWSGAPTRAQLFGMGVPVPGMRVGPEAHSQTSTRTTSNTAIPSDNTIPQNTEGVELLTATVILSSAANLVRSRFSASGTNNAGAASTCAIALFRDSVANAIAATFGGSVDNGRLSPFILEFTERAPAAGSTVYKIRFGPATAAGSGWAMNGGPAANYFGGVDYCQLAVEEIMA